jgi:Asp/Glu/hydantoin racemase
MFEAMKRRVSFLHTSPAAIPPLMRFYSQAAPDLEVINILEDGLLRFFTAGDWSAAENRLHDMLGVARDTYHAEVVMITCSAVPRSVLEPLQERARIPVFAIDGPMARSAVKAGNRIGVAVTFPPTAELTRALLLETAAEMGKSIELVLEVVPAAYDALLAGNAEDHDRLLLAGIDRLAQQNVDIIVLAQVSMARVQPGLEVRLSIPVFSSLETSLGAIRELLGAAAS